VESLLDELGIPRFNTARGGRRRRIPLHTRIESIDRPRLVDVRSSLLAIKWIGNVGSHAGPLTQDDIFDAYDLLEIVLRDIYEQDRAKADRLARRINQKKGPRSKRRVKNL
jgi:hypothetical protein